MDGKTKAPKGEVFRPKKKRFYTLASCEKRGNGYVILLDGRPVKTPMKAELTLPFEGLAQRICTEWNEQGEMFEPDEMHFTRYANTSIDRVATRPSEIVDELMGYAEFDLLFYHSPVPPSLKEQQTSVWGGLLKKMEEGLSVRFATTTGLEPVLQGEGVWQAVRTHYETYNPFQLTALYNITTLTSSCLLALCFAKGFAKPEEIWQASILDEEWQQATWGKDEEAEKRLQDHQQQLLIAAQFFTLSQEKA